MEVAVCVITYRRPEGLKRLLESLNALTFQAQALDLRVVVVENDETGLAQRVCNDVRSTLRWPLEYHVEPQRGIPFARNKAVAVAKQTADFIAFIDDDEVPDAGWRINTLDRHLFSATPIHESYASCERYRGTPT